MKITKQKFLPTRIIYKIVHLLILMSKFVIYCPWNFDKRTGLLTVGKYRQWLIPFIFLTQFFGFVFFRFHYLQGIRENPFLMLSLVRGILFTLHQFYYTVEIVINRKMFTTLVS